MAALTSGHPIQTSIITIHFRPCYCAFLPKSTCSILFCGIFVSNLCVLGDIWQYNVEIRKLKFL